MSREPSRNTSLPPLPEHPLVVRDVVDLVGDTPLLRLDRIGRGAPRAEVLAKGEHLNPGGSLKDRICLAIIEEAERTSSLGPGGVVVEASSGNTGIGVAIVCASKGYRCIVTMPASMSLERRQILASYGAEVVLTDPEAQMEGAMARAREIAAATPGAFLLAQFERRENPRVHRDTTAEEIFAALEDRGGAQAIDALVLGVGTGGAISGIGEALRRRGSRARIVAVEPATSATISRGERGPTRIQGLGAGFVPDNYDASVVDEVRRVGDREAYETKVALARTEGLLVGLSSGAIVHVALDVARELGPGKLVVTMSCDTGERYFSMEEYFSP